MTATDDLVTACPDWCEAHTVDSCGGPIYDGERGRISVFNELDRVTGRDVVVVEQMTDAVDAEPRLELTQREAFSLMHSLALALGERYGITEANA